MQRAMFASSVAAFGILTTLTGFASPVFAQSKRAASPAEMLGIQERSIQGGLQPQRSSTPITQAAQVNDRGSSQLVLYRIDQNTRVLVGPAKTAEQPGDFSGNTSTGDNRLRLLHDLNQ